MTESPFLPPDFIHPKLAQVSETHHVRPIRPDDVDIDFIAVMGSRESLWRRYGEANRWPREDMTKAEDEADLARHEREMTRNESFNYALLNAPETVLAGCVYIDPPADAGADADVSWWVTDDLENTAVEAALDIFVPNWITTSWPFRSPRFDRRSRR